MNLKFPLFFDSNSFIGKFKKEKRVGWSPQVQHTEIYLYMLGLKVQYDEIAPRYIVCEHVILYLQVDILGKCAIQWWISWANVQYNGGYLGQMCNTMVDILGKCAIQWWISWANVQYNGGYLGQMCNTVVDILGKCAIPCMVNILGKCAISIWRTSWTSVQYHGRYLGQMYNILVDIDIQYLGGYR